MNQAKLSFFQKIKDFLAPIKYTKGRWWVFLITEIYDAFQSVFIIQIGTYIIAAIEKNNIPDVNFWCIILGSIFVLNYIIGRFSEMIDEFNDGLFNIGFRKEYYDKYIHLDNTKVETIGTGKMQNIIFQGIDNRQGVISSLLPALIVEIGAILYAFVLIANKAPNLKYFLGFVGLFVIAATLMWIGLGVLTKTRKKSKEIRLDISRRDVKVLMSKFEILQNNKLEEELEKQKELFNKKVKLRQRANTIKVFRQTGSRGIIDGIQVMIYLSVGIGVITGKYQFAYMMLLLQLLNMMSRYIWNIRKYLKDYFKSIVHIQKLQETFTSIPFIRIGEDEKKFKYKTGNISLQNINFAYEKKNIFKNFSLNISGGRKTAFVGPSGGGKTTLIKLIAGYVRANEGIVAVDGQDINEIKILDYYAHVGYLTQDPSVFDGTILENLTYALKEIPSKRLLDKIIKESKCDFIRDFEKGRDTEIGERGIRLSGGQKQRLAIAKIMLKNPNIVLLDEPTSALDSFNEEQVSIALHNLFQGRTVVVVAHRLQTVKQADKIYYLESGEYGSQVVEEGTHAELVKQNGKYKKMLDLQSGF